MTKTMYIMFSHLSVSQALPAYVEKAAFRQNFSVRKVRENLSAQSGSDCDKLCFDGNAHLGASAW